MQGQYQPRVPGIAAGQSARNTTATYFDYQGIMRTAQPGELRLNFVYQNGVWVQDGWLREGAVTNNTTAVQYDNYHLNGETCTPAWNGTGYAVTLQAAGKNGNPCTIWGMPSGNCGSFFLKCTSIDFINVGQFGSNSPIQCGPNLWRFYASNTQQQQQPQIFNLSASPLYVEYGMFQSEPGTTPTSWIPYGQTRDAD